MANTAKKENSATKVIFGPETRWSYVSVWEPYQFSKDSKPKYQLSLLVKKSDTAMVAKITAAIEAAYAEGVAKWKGKVPKLDALKDYPLHDGDEEKPDNEEYHGCYFVSAKSDTQPGVVDKNRNPITDQQEVYSGCYGRASVNFYPFDFKGTKGVAAGLNNLQKIKDGEPLSGKPRAEDDFNDGEEFEDEDVGADFLD